MNDYAITLRDDAKPHDYDGNHCCRFMAQYVTPHGFCAWGIRSGRAS